MIIRNGGRLRPPRRLLRYRRRTSRPGRASCTVPLERHGFAGDPSAEIALADLQKSLAARRQVVHQPWGAAGETQRVDQVQIGTQTWCDEASVREAEVARVAVREHLDGGLRR